MRRIHILTRGFESPNGRAFLFPLVVHRRALADAGLDISFHCNPADPRTVDCDALFIESRVYSSRWATEGDTRVLEDIADLGQKAPVAWFDISDSTGWLQPQVLPLVKVYAKSQLLQDRNIYMQPHYGNRIWADYYHRAEGITDMDEATPRVVVDSAHLDRLCVSWNSGLADYSLHGPTRMALRQKLPIDWLLRVPTDFTPAHTSRDIPFTCRMGINYSRATVSHQRRRIAALLDGRMATNKLGRRAFLEEMRNTRLVVSPFGFGEITLKDFEATLCGSTLLKPDMSHMETWPNIFRSGETIVAYKWDLSDILEIIDTVDDQSHSMADMAAAAQETYRSALIGPTAAHDFVSRFSAILNNTLNSSGADGLVEAT
ncbi:MAG: hypothetical protein CL573_01785 [Alphaproteobacteria bacterium]|nr:hypothetical protein [Alphaproteobacteria bacterium]HCP00908.1 hypothetical protein [Rhodospirillaceae bacterium]